MRKILPHRGENLPNVYLVGFSIFVIVSLVATSFLFWDNYFKKTLLYKTEGIASFIKSRPRQEKPEVILSLNPKADVFQVDKDFQVELIIDTLDKEVWGADLKIAFDPGALIIKKVDPGDFFNRPLVLENQVDKQKNQVSFSIGSLEAAKGEGVLAILEVRPIRTGKTSLVLAAGTQVALKDKNEPALVEYQNFDFSVAK